MLSTTGAALSERMVAEQRREDVESIMHASCLSAQEGQRHEYEDRHDPNGSESTSVKALDWRLGDR